MDYKFFRNKKGEEPGVFDNVIFIILNLVFFLAMMFFIFRASSGAMVYEQAYAKEIALLLDESKANTTFIIDMTEGVQIAEKSKKTSEIVSINNLNKEVSVSLIEGEGYKFNYFSDYNVSYRMNNNYLIISVGERMVKNDK